MAKARTPDHFDPSNEPELAIVKFYNEVRGFGFVMVADPDNNVLSDLFIHSSALTRSELQTIKPQYILRVTRGLTPSGKPCVWQITEVVATEKII